MSFDTAHSLASNWAGLFAAIWFARDLHQTEKTARFEYDEQLDRATSSGREPRGRRRKRLVSRFASVPDSTDLSTGRRSDEQPNTAAGADSHETWHRTGRSVPDRDGMVGSDGDTDSPWARVDLFPTRPARTGSRFDQTLALPIDAPRALDATIKALELRLRALPERHDLSRRSASYRVQLERTRAEAISAKTRLADGSYGLCTVCSAPISLAVLSEKPWSPTCIHCALDI
jgi:hypothetical protein